MSIRRPVSAFATRLAVTMLLAISANLVAVAAAPDLTGSAQAQTQPKERRGWNPLAPLLRLFGPPKTERQQFRRDRKRDYAPKRRAAPEIVRVRKNEDAHRVLVVGDEFARGLANELDVAFAQSADVIVLHSTEKSSGLADSEAKNWPQEIGPIVEDKRADVVVVMIGTSDHKGVASETGLIQPENGEWPRAYGLRVLAFLNQLARREIPVFWVGLVPMKEQALSEYASQVTAIFREHVTLAGGVFVDIWDSFADAEGHYTGEGPDVNGRTRQLRAADGIGFTKSGFRKVAFFVERELRGRLGPGSKLAAIQAITDEPEVVEIGTVIPLYDSRIGLTVELAGATAEPAKPEPDTPQYRLVVAGEELAAETGRVDDFRWQAAVE